MPDIITILHVVVPTEVANKFAEQAIKEGRTVSQVLERLVSEYADPPEKILSSPLEVVKWFEGKVV